MLWSSYEIVPEQLQKCSGAVNKSSGAVVGLPDFLHSMTQNASIIYR